MRAPGGATGDAAEIKSRLDTLAAQNERLERELRAELAQARSENAQQAQTARSEVSASLSQFARTQQQQLSTLIQTNEQRLEAVRASVEQRLEALRNDNAHKLEQIRSTVDEKLHATLEQRLGESFKLVSDRLEQVHKGLGEMQTLATGVGDLKRVLSNVKSRGGWGEVQLGALLEEALAPAQYAKNVATRPGEDARVEYAIKLPGRSDDGAPCWLPIDAKFPLEDYQRLQDAIDRADIAAVEASRKALEDFFKSEARKIRDKYVEPPYTTDFAILFIPTEGLYAEALSRPGLSDALQRDFRVVLAGPSNLHAFINSLQLGFRSLAIEQRSTEVWRVLAAVKTEFGKFGELLAKTKDRLDAVGKTLDEAGRKSTTIARKLRDVEALPEAEADRLLTGESGALYDRAEEEAEPAPDDAV
ncbi:MAG TPA: DNA recombination protein RmuC [Casimicrobiaceae bacterium]